MIQKAICSTFNKAREKTWVRPESVELNREIEGLTRYESSVFFRVFCNLHLSYTWVVCVLAGAERGK